MASWFPESGFMFPRKVAQLTVPPAGVTFLCALSYRVQHGLAGHA
jgi:hypothetical protein